MYSACVERRLRAAVLAVAVIVFAACGGEPPSAEQRVHGAIDGLAQAVEAASIRQAAEFLDPQYRDDRHPNKAAAMRSLFAYMRQHRDIHLFTLIKTVELAPDGRAANVVVYVAMTGIPVDSVQTLISLNADMYRFDVDLLPAADGQWRVTHAQWRRADLTVL